jgi:hypothetical protein
MHLYIAMKRILINIYCSFVIGRKIGICERQREYIVQLAQYPYGIT